MASAILMSILLLTGLGVFALTARRKLALMFAARRPESRFDEPGRRIAFVLKYVFGQARMFRYWWAGIAHAFIFTGFVVLGLRTITLAARGFTGYSPGDLMGIGYRPGPGFGFWLFDDDAPLGMAYLFLKDIIGVFVIAGVLYFLYARLVSKPKRMNLSVEGVFILCMIMGLIVADLVYESSALVMLAGGGNRSFHLATPVASLVANVMAAMPPLLMTLLHHVGFWAHTVLVLLFLNFLPHGKHFHVLTVVPQVYLSNPQPRGRLEPIADMEGKLERGETLGVKTAADLSWKGVLDLYTCTECGRCTDQCPANRTGKLLSPKFLTTQLRDHMKKNERVLVGAAAAASDGATERRSDEGAGDASAPATATVSWRAPDGSTVEDGSLVPSWIDPETIWACTTCGACEQECPVFISYVDKIVDIRRNLVMERGEFPDQLQNAFRGLESVGNPYSFANEQRAEWAAGLDVPLLSEKPDAEILFWVGCAPSFDDRSRKIARALATLLKTAGVDFAILGAEERCTGDPARRAGNEYLFQMFAQGNVETLNSNHVKRIVTTCPHCFNTIKNEYPDFGGKFEVVHHTDYLLDLIRAGKLRPEHHVLGSIVYHDSCYLGRYNDVYDAPREILKAIPGLKVVEAPESRDRGMCCGAGGAQMWKEEEHVRDQNARDGAGKVNHARVRQLLRVLPSAPPPSQSGEAGASNGSSRMVASACPFCMTMLRDGLRDQGHEDVSQMDVAEVLLKAVQGAASA